MFSLVQVIARSRTLENQLAQLKQEDFDREVLLSSTPTIVDFYADWCGPCRAVGPIIEGLSEEFRGRVKFVKVNTDENQELSERYGILSIPTVAVFVGGRVVDTIIGVSPALVYRNKIQAVLAAKQA
jgi:thioredoxin 1